MNYTHEYKAIIDRATKPIQPLSLDGSGCQLVIDFSSSQILAKQQHASPFAFATAFALPTFRPRGSNIRNCVADADKSGSTKEIALMSPSENEPWKLRPALPPNPKRTVAFRA